VATIAFGDDCYGAAPDERANVTATYRIGLGVIGNVAANTLVQLVPRAKDRAEHIVAVTNPLPAIGGREPETRNHARRYGPETFKTPLVAVTAADYEETARGFLDRPGHHPIQRAHAEFRWTGSWLTVTLAVDPTGSEALDPILRSRLLDALDGRRLAGYDLEVIGALYVPIELDVELCIRPGFRPDSVIHEVEIALSDEIGADGRRGFFHADNFTFGDPIVVSKLYRAIHAVPGVESAAITRLARLRSARPSVDTQRHIRLGILPIASDEIVLLDDDRNFRERGLLTVREKGAGA
jgi:predicted phage baseplate assembly protein